MDLKLVYKDPRQINETGVGDHLLFDLLAPKAVGVEVMVNKVLNKLLTSVGSDYFSPTSGSMFKQYLQGSTQDSQQLMTDVNNYFRIVGQEIIAGERLSGQDDQEEGLQDIRLKDIYPVTDPIAGKGLLIEFIITTNFGNKAVASFNTLEKN